MKSFLLLLGLCICQPLLASGGALKPIGPYGAGVEETQLKGISLRNYYPTKKQANTTTLQNTPISYSRFPTLIFVPDEDKHAQDYEGLILQMVSHGYIVVTINKTTEKLLDSLLQVRRAFDTKKGPLAKLAHHMQLQHIGLMGCTKGSNATALAIQNHPKLFYAGVSLNEANPQVGSKNRPFLRLLTKQQASANNIKPFTNNYVISLNPKSIKPQLVDYYVLQFFNMYLKGIRSNCLAHCLSVTQDSIMSCGKYQVLHKEFSLPSVGSGPHQQVSGMLQRFGAIN